MEFNKLSLILSAVIVILLFITVGVLGNKPVEIKEINETYPSIYIVGLEPVDTSDHCKLWALFYTIDGYSQYIYFDTKELANKYLDYLNKLSGNKLEGYEL